MKNKSVKTYISRIIKNRYKSHSKFKPSIYWADFSRNFRYVYNLSAAELKRIRYHTFHLTSDSYLSYYFASKDFKLTILKGYNFFIKKGKLALIDEGRDGIGVNTKFGLISHDLVRYLGVVCDLLDADVFNKKQKSLILEIGGGYGGLARSILINNSNSSYFIIDLEETLFFSAIYLSNKFGASKVHLINKTLKPNQILSGHIYIVPQSKIKFIDDIHFNLVISQQSLQEMTAHQVKYYLAWIKKHADFMYSCNLVDHGNLATHKKIVLNLPDILINFFNIPLWIGKKPAIGFYYGDNHLNRAVYKCE
jgi:hypothetical protein